MIRALTLLIVAWAMNAMSTIVIQAQSDIDEKSQEVIEKCIAAMGSRMALAEIETLQIESRADDGNPLHQHLVSGQKIRTRYQELIIVHDGQHCWETAAGGQPVLRESMGQTGFVMLFPLPQTVLSWQEFAGKIRTPNNRIGNLPYLY